MSSLHVPLWGWVVTIGAVVLILGSELAIGIRRGPREISLRAAAAYVAVVIAAAGVFGLSFFWLGHPAAGSQFFAGWLTEYSLSLDNLFVFVLLIGSSSVPRELHGRVMLLGIGFALLLRGIVIAIGAAAISRFSWVLYLFGALLVFAAVRVAFTARRDPASAPSDSVTMRAVSQVVPVTTDSADGRLIGRVGGREGGRRAATPLLLLGIGVAATDLVFAMDSIPAVFGLTHDAYLVFTANAFALLGLRQLYFLLGGLLSRLAHLPAGLAVILAFIGVKLFAEALAASGIRSVGPVPVPHISTAVSLCVIGGVLLIVTATSLLRGLRRRSALRPAARPGSGPDPPRRRGAAPASCGPPDRG